MFFLHYPHCYDLEHASSPPMFCLLNDRHMKFQVFWYWNALWIVICHLDVYVQQAGNDYKIVATHLEQSFYSSLVFVYRNSESCGLGCHSESKFCWRRNDLTNITVDWRIQDQFFLWRFRVELPIRNKQKPKVFGNT